MAAGEFEIARQWLAKADNDLLNADNNLNSENIPFDTVCFHCQQAAEKILKAYLVANQEPYPVTHDLLMLLERILQLDATADRLRDTLAVLAPYAVEIRYPDDYCMPTDEDAAEARKAAAEVYKWCESACPAMFSE